MRPNASILLLLLLAFGSSSCSKKEVVPPPPKAPPIEKKEPDKKKEESQKENIPEAIFGIPTPPNSFNYMMYDNLATLLTRLNREEVLDFYRKRSSDFEVIDNKTEIFIVGLRSEMGSASFSRIDASHPIPLRMTLSNKSSSFNPSPDKKEEQKEEAAKKEKEEKSTGVFTGNRYLPNAAKVLRGKPVEIRGDDGQLLAPGAVWGEYYTPPEGSYFHQKQFEANWGMPFGEWIPQ